MRRRIIAMLIVAAALVIVALGYFMAPSVNYCAPSLPPSTPGATANICLIFNLPTIALGSVLVFVAGFGFWAMRFSHIRTHQGTSMSRSKDEEIDILDTMLTSLVDLLERKGIITQTEWEPEIKKRLKT